MKANKTISLVTWKFPPSNVW